MAGVGGSAVGQICSDWEFSFESLELASQDQEGLSQRRSFHSVTVVPDGWWVSSGRSTLMKACLFLWSY